MIGLDFGIIAAYLTEKTDHTFSVKFRFHYTVYQYVNKLFLLYEDID